MAAPPALFAAETLEAVEGLASEWVKLRLERSRLETEWQTERGLVESMAKALEERAALLEEKRDLAKAKTTKDREELESMRAKNQAAVAELQTLETRLKGLTQKLIALRPSLPPRLSDALEMAYRSLENSELAAGERMQLAMNVLNRCAQFNRMITASEDALTLEGEPTEKSFEVIYWGLSHGYAIDRRARKAWLGSPARGGWRWEPRPDAFEAIAQLLAIARDKADPDFIRAPATVTRMLVTETKN